MESAQEGVTGNPASGKEGRDCNSTSTSFFSQLFP